MPKEVVTADIARAIRRKKVDDSTIVTLVNNSAVDVYYDTDPNRLNQSAPGAVPDGTKLAANGGSAPFFSWPGVIWVRAATQTTIEVQP